MGSTRPSWWASAWLAWAEAERGRFVPWLPVCMGLGVVGYFAQAAEPDPRAGLVAVAVAVLACAAGWRVAWMRGAGFALLAVALGFLSGQAATWRALPIEPLPARAVVLTGVVRGVDLLPDGRRVTFGDVQLAPDPPTLSRQVRVRLHKADAAPMAVGDRVRVRALLRPPSSPTHPGGWDQQRDAYFNGVAGSGYALNPSEIVSRAPPGGVLGLLRAARDGMEQRLAKGLPGTAGAIAGSLLVGSQAAIPRADQEAFRDSGLAHLLSVSGLHMAIVLGCIMGGTRALLALSERAALHWPTKTIAACTALAGGGVYMLLTGASVPIIRCFAMAALVVLGLVVGRRALSMRGLALAAAAVMAIAPHEVLGVSFAMSFAAVLALIAGYEAMRPVLAGLQGGGWGRRALSHLAALVLTSLLAGTASAPFGAYHFGHFQVYYVVSNIIAVPLTSVWIMPLGLVALALMPLGLEALALVPMGWGIDGLLWLARAVAAWPASTLAVPHITAWGLGVFALGLAWTGLWHSRLRWAGVPVMLAGLLSPLTAPPPDVLVSSEARLIAVRQGPTYVQARPGASKFIREAWQNHLASGPLLPLRTGEPPACDADACRLGPPNATVLVLRGAAGAGDCTGIALLVSAEPARSECPASVPYVDRFSVWRNGAHAIWLTNAGPRVLSDRAFRGERPWVAPVPTPRRSVPNLPMAATEDLPPAAEE